LGGFNPKMLSLQKYSQRIFFIQRPLVSCAFYLNISDTKTLFRDVKIISTGRKRLRTSGLDREFVQ